MNRLYERKPLLHALLWILIYVMGSSVCQSLTGGKDFLPLFHAVLTAALAFWIGRRGLSGHFGLCRARYPARRFLWYVPLILIPCVNLAGGLRWNEPVRDSILAALSMVFVGFLEEVIFRGLLFKALRPDGVRKAMVISAVTFGLGHIVNLFNNSGNTPLSTVLQVVYAMALGFLFVVLFERGGSLWGAIAVHSATNTLGVFASPALQGRPEILLSALLTAVAAGYAVYLLKRLPTPEE